jgi:hypothetical protein
VPARHVLIGPRVRLHRKNVLNTALGNGRPVAPVGRPAATKTVSPVNGFTFQGGLPVLLLRFQKGTRPMTCLYDEFAIECFEAGRGLWHARIRRADRGPLMINGVSFPSLEVGFAWSSSQAAIADAKSHIDRFGLRWACRQDMAAPKLAAAV